MNKKWNLLYVAIAMVLLLTACGTANTSDGDSNGSTSTVDDTTNIAVDKDNEEEEEKVTAKDDLSNESNDTTSENKTKTSIEEQTETIVLEYTDGEIVESKEAQLKESDEQDYSMYVLPLYELTGEEPGRDILYFNDDDGSIFMRIEMMTIEEDTYAYAVENTLAVLEASANGASPEELTDASLLPSGKGIEKVKAYFVQSDTIPVTGIVFERGAIVVKLTIFDSVDSNHYDAFLRMGETITQK